MRRLRVFDSAGEMEGALAARWQEAAGAALSRRGTFRAALSGGRSPEGFYRALARREDLPWERTEIYQVDERMVPRDDDRNNYRMIERALSAADLDPARMHPMDTGGASAAESASRYAELLSRLPRSPGGFPSFDFILLGLGADGHTASLFPGSDALGERERWVRELPGAGGREARITLTLPVLNAAREVVFLVTGEAKRHVVGELLAGGEGLPASLVRPEGGGLSFFLDVPAAGEVADGSIRL